MTNTNQKLLNKLKNNVSIIDLIKKGIISEEDFDYTKYNGCEIIP